MNTQYSVWIMAQVSPSETVLMSKCIVFQRTAFLIKGISVFSKDKLCGLSSDAS